MQAEVISIGDEMTSGQRLDTNSQWLSQRLGELGIRVMYHTTVADDLAANVRVFQQAAQRADIIVATGGLGPTADDLTREVLAELAGVPLVLQPAALEHIESLFARRKRPMPERNRVQAMFPSGSVVIHNPEGTAPGIDLQIPRAGQSACRIFALPGVPAEMRQMWSGTLADAIAQHAGSKRVIRHRLIKCFGVGESDLEAMLPDLIRRGRTPQVGITVSGATITLRITAEGETPNVAYAVMDSTVATIHECLGDLVFGEEDDELEHAVARLLVARNQRLATTEIGSAGQLAHWFGELPDELAGCFCGGQISSQPFVLTIDPQAAADDRRAKQMLELSLDQALSHPRADYALAVGIFPPLPTAGQPAREFFYGVSSRDGSLRAVRSSPFVGHSALVKLRAAKQALNLLRLELLHAQPASDSNAAR